MLFRMVRTQTTLVLHILFHFSEIIKFRIQFDFIVGPLLALFTMGVLMPWINGLGAIVGGSISLVFMAWLCFRAQAAIATGELTFTPKPTFTNGCEYSFIANSPLNMLAINQTAATIIDDPITTDDPDFAIYRISYMWYTLVGALITITIATIVSFLSGFNNPRKMDAKLFAPCIRKLLRLNDKREEPVGIESDAKHDSCIDLKVIS